MANSVAIEVEGVSKSFRLPLRRVDTLRERIAGGLKAGSKELPVLRDISFEVNRGQFFGIAGRNGSGKSTLLKIIAGIYQSDSGQVRTAGRLAPIIELGVGFNNELPAYDNVVMNAVIMGLEPSEARERYPEILEFSELGEFEHLKLKNYSSGMKARLGFSIMVHVEADLLLFDEVLAVGDSNFKAKSAETFKRLVLEGRTGIFVTHSMGALQEHCDRAMLLEDGRIHTVGSPGEVAREYSALRSRTSLRDARSATASKPATIAEDSR